MKVAVVGCGLAGLRSAMLLEARGHEVLLFEARDRPGGRLHTAESGFEEGAEWVDEDHERMRGLMREVRVAEVPAPDGEYVLQFDGKRCLESAVWEDAARDLASFEAAARNGPMGDSIDDLIDSVCKSAAGRWLVTANVRTDEGDEPARLGLAPWIAFRDMYALRGGREASAFRIGGGGSALVQRLLERIACKPVFGARLLRVTQGDQVRLEFEGFSSNADAAILALPLPCLLGVVIDPPLHNREALAKLGFAPAVKARFEFDEPFWKHGGWSGYMKSDLLLQQTWPDCENERALLAYIVGDNARTLEHNPAIGETLAREWKKWDAGLVPINTEIKNWTRDEFACGAFSLALPGSNPPAVRQRRSGNVQIAGEFCATWMGFMEGALESAETAVAALS